MGEWMNGFDISGWGNKQKQDRSGEFMMKPLRRKLFGWVRCCWILALWTYESPVDLASEQAARPRMRNRTAAPIFLANIWTGRPLVTQQSGACAQTKPATCLKPFPRFYLPTQQTTSPISFLYKTTFSARSYVDFIGHKRSRSALQHIKITFADWLSNDGANIE